MSWTNPPAEAKPVALFFDSDISPNLIFNARVHYWSSIHHGQPERVLIVDSWNWQIGRHLYFVPVYYMRDLPDLHRRHYNGDAGNLVSIVELHWHEFERHFPPFDARISHA